MEGKFSTFDFNQFQLHCDLRSICSLFILFHFKVFIKYLHVSVKTRSCLVFAVYVQTLKQLLGFQKYKYHELWEEILTHSLSWLVFCVALLLNKHFCFLFSTKCVIFDYYISPSKNHCMNKDSICTWVLRFRLKRGSTIMILWFTNRQ